MFVWFCGCRLARALEHPVDVDADAPKPVLSVEEAPFPDWALRGLQGLCLFEPTPVQVDDCTLPPKRTTSTRANPSIPCLSRQ